MSRSGYSDECDGAELILWRGAVDRAIEGKRGQELLKDLRSSLDAMPVKELVAWELETEAGQVCALGAVGKARGVAMTDLDPHDRDAVGKAFNIAPAMAAEIVFMNDEWGGGGYPEEDPAKRWTRMRAWVESKILTVVP